MAVHPVDGGPSPSRRSQGRTRPVPAKRRTDGTIRSTEDGSPESLLLALPLRAVLEVVFACLDLLLATPAFGVWPPRRPLEVLTCETMPSLQLAKSRGEPLVSSSHNRVCLLLVAGPVLPALGPDELSLGPPAGIYPSLQRTRV